MIRLPPVLNVVPQKPTNSCPAAATPQGALARDLPLQAAEVAALAALAATVPVAGIDSTARH